MIVIVFVGLDAISVYGLECYFSGLSVMRWVEKNIVYGKLKSSFSLCCKIVHAWVVAYLVRILESFECLVLNSSIMI